MKITYSTPKKTEYESVTEQIVDQASLPEWAVSNSKCDKCDFDFDSGSHILAIKTETGKVLYIHNSCMHRND